MTNDEILEILNPEFLTYEDIYELYELDNFKDNPIKILKFATINYLQYNK